ncbi:RING finger protein-like protein [Cucurbitaria berberidis CBS 394.84]|uniref:RBR-type E3 ubiquitin transferase n=1 Tax=Cucurbitaria berberidis CBS 394.84 TaxID=1168544 RepID=A0A9P4L7Y7_9PLEO|nr:RING finger protein-like protein [Cucurbitaria berberidis CBS 394.84]KAF1844807.1 RING finger protein-like protein [Cucurbitaria berberidis CBS 394.84]
MDLGDERTEELDTLQSIYPELVLDPNQPYTARLDLLVAPTKPLPVTFEPDNDVQRLAYLPLLHLHIILPAEYPAETCPVVKVSTSPSWLPEHVLNRLADEANSIWEEYGGGTILFSYISSMQEQADASFGLEDLTLASSMRAELVEYSRRMKKELFDKETFDCGVCLEPKKGSACYRMERCSHVFCIACLQDYYNNCIKEGDVNNVKCMSTECGKSSNRKKKDRLLSPKELLQIPIAREQVDRYATIKRKKKIESDPTIVFCPRTWCQGAMRTDKYPKITDVSQMDGSDSEPEEEDPAQHGGTDGPDGPEKRAIGVRGMERLAVCEDCNLAFCVICLASWHGDFVRCEPRDATQLTEEDQASLNFIQKNTSPCPYCSVPCQKSMGCNHITCTQCETHFCYLCAAWLNPDHPYAHFNDPKNKHCFQRLMDGVEGDLANDNIQFGGRRGADQVADFWEQEAMRIQMEVNDEDTR